MWRCCQRLRHFKLVYQEILWFVCEIMNIDQDQKNNQRPLKKGDCGGILLIKGVVFISEYTLFQSNILGTESRFRHQNCLWTKSRNYNYGDSGRTYLANSLATQLRPAQHKRNLFNRQQIIKLNNIKIQFFCQVLKYNIKC